MGKLKFTQFSPLKPPLTIIMGQLNPPIPPSPWSMALEFSLFQVFVCSKNYTTWQGVIDWWGFKVLQINNHVHGSKYIYIGMDLYLWNLCCMLGDFDILLKKIGQCLNKVEWSWVMAETWKILIWNWNCYIRWKNIHNSLKEMIVFQK